MFGIVLRLLLILGSFATIAFMLVRIRTSQIQIRDSIFWLLFSLVLLVISVVPEVTMWASQALDIQSPINFVYLFIIFILLIKLFSNSIRISQMDAKIQQLVQRIALHEKKNEESGHKTSPQDDVIKP